MDLMYIYIIYTSNNCVKRQLYIYALRSKLSP